MRDEAKKINKNRQKKQKIIAEIADKVKRAKALIFANYTGMTHKQLENLKKAVKKTDAELVVTKNTLLKRAIEMENGKWKMENGKWKMENWKVPPRRFFLIQT